MDTSGMQLYAILRRNAWSEQEIQDAAARSAAELERRADQVRMIRSYVLAEGDDRLGTICLYQATGPEAVRAHARAAGLPADEVIPVAATAVERPDPEPAGQHHSG